MSKTQHILVLGTLACATLAPAVASAKKPGVLEGKPIVVDRLELRKLRFQVTPNIGMSLSQPFVHKGFVGANLRFDFTDWIGIRGMFQYGVINLDSKLLRDLNGGALPREEILEPGAAVIPEGCAIGLPCRPDAERLNPAPLRQTFQAGLTRLQWQSSLDVAFTPFSGKLGLFQAIFTEYDIYVFGGLGLTGWERVYPNVRTISEDYGIVNTTDRNSPTYCRLGADGTGAQNNECFLHPVRPETGVRIGGSFGAGVHVFITDWVSINPEFQDIVIRQNIAGLNATVGETPLVVDKDDRTVVHNVTFSLGATFYFPPKAKRSKLKP